MYYILLKKINGIQAPKKKIYTIWAWIDGPAVKSNGCS